VFNRATQAQRQTGSSFKPYVYTAAIEDGAKPDDSIVDGPVSFGDYTPHNYENDYKGRMTLINAFAESRNIPALKLAAHVGMHKVIELTHRFGVTSNIPAYLPVALGAAEITLEEQVASYSVFPNDGLRVQPRLVRKVSNSDGITLWEDPPEVKEVLSQQTARTMMTFLQAVTAHGTGAAASELHHPLGGKTGTTSDYTDAWFLGFSPSVTCGVWVGFDSRESLGEKETGAKAALPIWMAIMKQAIAGKDNEHFLGDESGPKTPLLQAKLEVPEKPGMPAKSAVAATKNAVPATKSAVATTKSAIAAPKGPVATTATSNPRIPNASFLPYHFSPAHNTVPAPPVSAKAHVVTAAPAKPKTADASVSAPSPRPPAVKPVITKPSSR